MLTLANLFRSNKSETSYHYSLGKDKDGRFFADPMNLNQLDQFESHKADAEMFNTQRDLLARVREVVLPLDGSEHDKNPRKGIVAVTGFPVDGRSVDAVVVENDGLVEVEARVCDEKPVTSSEKFGYRGQESYIYVTTEDRVFKATDFRIESSPPYYFVQVS